MLNNRSCSPVERQRVGKQLLVLHSRMTVGSKQSAEVGSQQGGERAPGEGCIMV